MIRLCRKDLEMSEALATMCLLTASGGLQDAYSYLVRGGVFANAQTGNVVLLGVRLAEGNPSGCVHYLIPLLSFALGVFAAERIGYRFKRMRRIHWRQLVLFGEVVLLFLVGFLPGRCDMLANALVSFCCALQVQSFRKVHGYPFASTMCIGNLRSGIVAFSAFLRTHESSSCEMVVHYLLIIVMFAFGAALGGMLAPVLKAKLIWVSSALLFLGSVMMTRRKQSG